MLQTRQFRRPPKAASFSMIYAKDTGLTGVLSAIRKACSCLAGACLATMALAAGGVCLATESEERPPNVVIIFTDDMGYGDLSCYGSPTNKTPTLDRLAAEGQKWSSFYTAASVCTPSRAGLLTGRLPVRLGMCGKGPRVMRENGTGGMPDAEVTLAEYLSQIGYATACVGKWHLGHQTQFLPCQQGFDSFYGLRYSNDMERKTQTPGYWEACANPKNEDWFTSLLRNNDVTTREFNQELLTKTYTEESVRFIEQNKERPFFLYLAHSMPHVPIFRSEQFKGRSAGGRYGDVVEEIDWSVGQIVRALEEFDVAEHTLVLFTSDNGPWLEYKTHGGSAGMLRSGKGSTFEGGFRVPGIFWWPGKIQAGTVSGIGSTLDVMPTILSLTEQGSRDAVPHQSFDGYNLSPTLLAGSPSPREVIYYYRGDELFAIRKGHFKAHFKTQPPYFDPVETAHDPPLLYDLAADPGEKYDIAASHPEILETIKRLAAQHRNSITPAPNQLKQF